MTPFFRCAECGDHVKATEYGECAYCGGDVEIIDGEAQMIDIDHLERRIKYRDEDEPLLPPSPEEVLALIAEIRRLREISMPNGHRRCKCGSPGALVKSARHTVFWVSCSNVNCIESTLSCGTESAAWAAWDRVEG